MANAVGNTSEEESLISSFTGRTATSDGSSSSFTDKDMANLMGKLDELNFDDLEHLIPYTEEAEEELEHDQVDTLFAQDQAPFNRAELFMLRYMMRRNNELLFDDTVDKLIKEHRPELIADKSTKGRALRRVAEKELLPTSQLSEDTFSFLISAPLKSMPMFLGVSVLLLKVSLLRILQLSCIPYYLLFIFQFLRRNGNIYFPRDRYSPI